MKEIKVGLIGLGAMGVKHFGIYQTLPGVKVAAIVDNDLARLNGDISQVRLNGRRIAGDSLDLSSVQVFSDTSEMFQAIPELDMIDICLPTALHPQMIREGLAYKKAVFCEKPLCLDLTGAERLLNEIHESGCPFNLGLCVRMNPPYLHAKEFIQSGKAGKIQSAIFRRFSPRLSNWFVSEEKTGGALLDLHIHDADYVNFLFGCPDAVSAYGSMNAVSYESGIDQICAVYHYNDIPFVMAEGGWAAAPDVPFERNFTIIGEKATLQLNHEGYKIDDSAGGLVETELGEMETLDGWQMELKYFTDCLRAGVKPEKYQSLESISDTYRILKAEKESVLNRKKVVIKGE